MLTFHFSLSVIDIKNSNDSIDNKREIQSVTAGISGEKNWNQELIKSIKQINIKTGFGNIDVFESKNDQAKLNWEKIRGGEDCFVIIKDGKGKGEIEELSIEQSSPKLESECQINFKLALPKSSKVNAKQLLKSLVLKAGLGNIAITHLMHENAKLESTVGSGNITLSKVFFKEMNLKTGSGDVNVSLGKQILANTEGKLEIRTGSGDSSVSLPKASIFTLSHQVGMGNLNNKFDINGINNLKAQFKIDHKAGSGNLDIDTLN